LIFECQVLMPVIVLEFSSDTVNEWDMYVKVIPLLIIH